MLDNIVEANVIVVGREIPVVDYIVLVQLQRCTVWKLKIIQDFGRGVLVICITILSHLSKEDRVRGLLRLDSIKEVCEHCHAG